MIWLIIAKIITLVEAGLEYFVVAEVDFDRADDGQWILSQWAAEPTPKGWAVLADIATIVHNLLDFVAQFMTLLPMNTTSSGLEIPGNNTPYWFLP